MYLLEVLSGPLDGKTGRSSARSRSAATTPWPSLHRPRPLCLPPARTLQIRADAIQLTDLAQPQRDAARRPGRRRRRQRCPSAFRSSSDAPCCGSPASKSSHGDGPHRRAGACALRRAAASPGIRAHDGRAPRRHLALVKRARRKCAAVVASIFVNPLQFGPNEDLARLSARRAPAIGASSPTPASTRCSRRRLRRCTVRILRRTSTSGRSATRFEGAVRPRSLSRRATVIVKLLNIVRPDVLVLGQKDAQQAAILRKMVARSERSGASRGRSDGTRARRPRDVQPQPVSRRGTGARKRRRSIARCSR